MKLFCIEVEVSSSNTDCAITFDTKEPDKITVLIGDEAGEHTASFAPPQVLDFIESLQTALLAVAQEYKS